MKLNESSPAQLFNMNEIGVKLLFVEAELRRIEPEGLSILPHLRTW